MAAFGGNLAISIFSVDFWHLCVSVSMEGVDLATRDDGGMGETVGAVAECFDVLGSTSIMRKKL